MHGAHALENTFKQPWVPTFNLRCIARAGRQAGSGIFPQAAGFFRGIHHDIGRVGIAEAQHFAREIAAFLDEGAALLIQRGTDRRVGIGGTGPAPDGGELMSIAVNRLWTSSARFNFTCG